MCVAVVIGADVAIITTVINIEAAGERITGVLGTGITVIAVVDAVDTAAQDIAGIIGAGAAIIAIMSKVEASRCRIAVVIGAGISITATNGNILAGVILTEIASANIVVSAVVTDIKTPCGGAAEIIGAEITVITIANNMAAA